jgi:uncharacterized membrane protein
MNIQTIAVIILFLAALFYLCKMVYNSFNAKKGCASNCKCGVDFSEIEVKK